MAPPARLPRFDGDAARQFLDADPAQIVRLNMANWPNAGSDAAERIANSGLACAIVVFRHLLAFFPPDQRREILTLDPAGMATNGLVAAILLPDRNESLACLQRYFAANTKFEKIMENKTMAETIWSNELLCPFKPVFRKAGETAWVPMQNYLGVMGFMGMQIWDGKKRDSLSGFMACQIGQFSPNEQGTDPAVIPLCPLIMRVRYHSPDPGLDFIRDLSNFKIKKFSFKEGGGAVQSGYAYYNCVAVVKFRAGQDGDTVRLYTVNGQPIVPKDGKFPWSGDWRMENGGEYMLYYVRSDIPPMEAPAWSETSPVGARELPSACTDMDNYLVGAKAVLSTEATTQPLARPAGHVPPPRPPIRPTLAVGAPGKAVQSSRLAGNSPPAAENGDSSDDDQLWSKTIKLASSNFSDVIDPSGDGPPSLGDGSSGKPASARMTASSQVDDHKVDDHNTLERRGPRTDTWTSPQGGSYYRPQPDERRPQRDEQQRRQRLSGFSYEEYSTRHESEDRDGDQSPRSRLRKRAPPRKP
ncbi:hypothetical protein B0T24DRAFT_640012 [Lasiosphaeria ovina]|uniref:Uncharacterized protein n=1 Tax=Lasiosphaeria ovina TaxID=92902 RepID=A0AAE0JTS4_9PEZI|nr:hypothetical protein B0T24DRAFT_640012 [Lasiosphaeria ovina]